MQLPVARDEIAKFLETCPKIVDHLWDSKQLKRSIGCPYRQHQLLNWSSQYDVLEYALTSGDLPEKLSKEHAALWMCNLAEADETEIFEDYTFEQQVENLAMTAVEDGLSSDAEACVRIATTIFVSRYVLNNICLETDLTAA